MTYLDHAATTPVRAQVRDAMLDVIGQVGNPSSTHTDGRAARRVLEDARELLAARLGAHPTEVVLTSGGTEADNLAVKGLWWARVAADPSRRRVLVSAVEHHAVLDPADWLVGHGAEVVRLPVDRTGTVDLEALAAELDAHGDEVALVSVMWANNEIGTVQPARRVAELAHAKGVPVHCDAVQAAGHLPVDLADGGPDALAVSAHKLGGPVGVGALLLRRGLTPDPVLHGGGQERGVRSGTVPVAAAHAFAVAVDLAVGELEAEAVRLGALRDALADGALAAVPDACLSGPGRGPEHAGARLPGIVHLMLPGCDREALLLLLDRAGISCSTGSACRAGVTGPSHVVLACARPRNGETEAGPPSAEVRFSLGWSSTADDVAAALAALPDAVAGARAVAGAG